MATHLTLIRCPTAFMRHPSYRAAPTARESCPVAGHLSGPARLTTPDATGRRFVLALLRSPAPPARPDPNRGHSGASAAVFDHPA